MKVHPFACFTSFSTFLLLIVGAMVTSTNSGLAVPDWPLSFGTLFPEMVGGVFFEHGHRLVAGTVACLTVALGFWLYRVEPRGWVKVLGFTAIGVVFTQALLGGLTVLLKLPIIVSVGHALLAQAFFCLVVTLALVTSQWFSKRTRFSVPPGLRNFSLAVSIVFLAQLTLGAVMRHTGSGLAIPDFPTVFGGFFPSEFTFPILIHFLHRIGAFLIICLVSIQAAWVLRTSNPFSRVGHAGALVALVAFQGMMGAMVIWLKRPPLLTSLHLAVGALCLALSVTFTFLLFEDSEAIQLGVKPW